MLALSDLLKYNDLANPAASETTIRFEKAGQPTADFPSVYNGYCQAVHSEHYLIGKGHWSIYQK